MTTWRTHSCVPRSHSCERLLLAVENSLATLARRKTLAILLVGLTSLAARALLLPILPVPKPAIQDEFSYLLAADTFASGRLANPTPAFPEHFETLQVLMHPTYASKYPPLSGLVLALGQKLAGQPWFGILLATGLLSAAICWALQGWLPAPWALAASAIAVVQIGIVSYWTESYWGGTCAAIGGALLIGAVPRLIRRPSPWPALAFAAGLAALANTRPYEGLVLAIVCSAGLVYGFWRRRLGIGLLAKSAILPAAALLVPVLAWMAYYNYRVTGNPFELPYVEHERQYAIWSPLLWHTAPGPTPAYSNSFLEYFWTQADSHDKLEAREHLLKTHVSDLFHLGRFYLGLPLMICMLGFARPLWKDPTARSAFFLLAAFYAGAALDARLFPHYAAPAAALAYILAGCTLRAARNAWPGRFSERIYVPWALMSALVAIAALGLLSPDNRYLFGSIDYHVRAKRASVMEKLESVPGDHLVLVRYGPQHEPYEEFVYNRADIDRSRVIWARSLSPQKDLRLIESYPARQVWLLDDDQDLKLTRLITSSDKGTMITQLQYE
ncbi:MAG: hypothetical protein LAP38_04295 [Acidobacteriia bacterium]|nr:hypothetical protein [Terriglobia bacterium]